MSLGNDIRYAARSLLRRPALLGITTAALSIGIAANAVMFGVVDQLLLRPPALVQAPADLRRIYFRHVRDGEENTSSVTTYRAYVALRDNVPAFSNVALASFPTMYTLGAGASARGVQVQPVSGNYFATLGVQAAIGRTFAPQEDRPPQGDLVAVVSDGFWRQELGEAKNVIGRTIQLDGETFTIIGVAPRDFSGIDRKKVDVWVPISAIALKKSGKAWYSEANSWWIETFARLRPGATDAVAGAQATAAYRAESSGWRNFGRNSGPPDVLLGSIIGTRAPSGWTPESKVSLWLMSVSAIVLLIACANVANLLIARTIDRRREIAVRLALGITRSRLALLLLTETALLAGFSAGVALIVALLGSRFVQNVLLPGIVWSGSALDGRVLAFTLLATLLCIALAGMAPALQSVSLRVSEGLKAGATQIAGSRGRLRSTLLVVQAALSVVLLVGAGLFVRSLRKVTTHDVGIDLDRVSLVTIDLKQLGFDKPRVEDIYREGRDRLRTITGVADVSLVRAVIPGRMAFAMSVTVPGKDRFDFEGGGPYYTVADAAFFRTMGTTLLRGRTFTEDEDRSKNRSVIINRMVADAYWPGGDALGKCLRLGSDTTCSSVVGVVENVLMFRIVRDDRAMVYIPGGHAFVSDEPPSALLVRSSVKPATLVPAIRASLQSLAPNMPFVRIEPFTEIVAPQLRPWRLGATMFTLFGSIALVIAAFGLYSVMAYWVSQRTHEIGVRMALGANRGDIVALVAKQTSGAIVVGLAIGGVAAAVASKWIADLLYETSPRDPLVYMVAAITLVVAAVVACVVPARRSAAVDPARALRTE